MGAAPAFISYDRGVLCVEDATMMMIDILRHETLTSDEEEELQEYTETLITMGKYALWYEAKEGIENVIKAMEAKRATRCAIWRMN